MNKAQIIEMAKQADFYDPIIGISQLERFAQLAADHALEEAAKLLDANAEHCAALSHAALVLESNAAAIRAMKGKP
jgi:hypothetical protein